MNSTRSKWAGRVAAWRRSGQTAKAYARSIGVNAGTLAYWAWRLDHAEQRNLSSKRRPAAITGAPPAMIEVVKTGGSTADGFEILLRGGHRVQVPVGFDSAELKRLIGVLEAEA